MSRAAWHKLAFSGAVMSATAPALAAEHPAIAAFTAYCFKAGQTAEDARANMEKAAGTPLPFALEFWDTSLEPAPSAPAFSERRCEVSFAGDHAADAVQAVQAKMATPPVFGTPLPLPDPFAATPGTSYIEARELLRQRVAVVHIGTRADGAETFIRVDRLPAGQGLPS
ncbi:hypothetical protein [Tateyamaria sp. SN6-1]|uniref:hypothetical protein n=1 Tax=Tateyamaria sp. SN6-1 TaxID=3092148 RepID=UPI0039F5A276